ncbi:MAG: hypothetical protein ABI851_09170 [Saprospiraceae bacterium]
MKKYLILLITIIKFTNLQSQSVNESIHYIKNFVIQLMEYSGNHTYAECRNHLWPYKDSLSLHFENIYFYKDTHLIYALEDTMFNSYLINDDWPYDQFSILLELFNYKNYYLESIKYSNLNNIDKCITVLRCKYPNLISYCIKTINSSEFVYIFNHLNPDERDYLFSTVLRLFNRSQLDTIFSQIEDSISSDISFYVYKKNYADSFLNPLERDSMYELIKLRMRQIMDSTSTEYNDLYDVLFNNSQKISERYYVSYELEREASRLKYQRKVDSLFEIRKYKIDSLINSMNISRMKSKDLNDLNEMIRTGEIYSSNILEQAMQFNLASLSRSKYREYLIRSDTTMEYSDGYFSGSIGDDGRRFDTLSNLELFSELSLFDYYLLKDSLNTEYIFNSNSTIVHIQKITQLIGDRYLHGTLSLDSSSMLELNRLIDFCEFEIALDTSNSFWVSKCQDLLFRIWLPIIPRLYSWIINPDDKLSNFSMNYLYLLMNENMARELVRLGSEAMDQNDQQLAEKYIAPLTKIDSHKEAYLVGLPPRRYCTRTWDESVRWLNEFIYPAMLKVGWLEVIK